MRGSISAAAFAVAIGVASLAPSAAQADFIYNLTVGHVWFGSGSIAFDAPSGTDTVFSDITGVSAFSFHVAWANGGSLQDYDLADLASVTWSIDSASNLSLLLSTVLVPFNGSSQSAILLTNQAGNHAAPCPGFDLALPGSWTCELGWSSAGGALSAVPVPVAVPEPASIALFAAGLAGLGLLARRRKA